MHRVAYSRSAVICMAHAVVTQASYKAHILVVSTAESAWQTNSRYLEDGHVHMAACALWQRLQLDGKLACQSCYYYFR